MILAAVASIVVIFHYGRRRVSSGAPPRQAGPLAAGSVLSPALTNQRVSIATLCQLAAPGLPERGLAQIWAVVQQLDAATVKQLALEIPQHRPKDEAWEQVRQAVLERWLEVDSKGVILAADGSLHLTPDFLKARALAETADWALQLEPGPERDQLLGKLLWSMLGQHGGNAGSPKTTADFVVGESERRKGECFLRTFNANGAWSGQQSRALPLLEKGGAAIFEPPASGPFSDRAWRRLKPLLVKHATEIHRPALLRLLQTDGRMSSVMIQIGGSAAEVSTPMESTQEELIASEALPVDAGAPHPAGDENVSEGSPGPQS